MHLAAANDSTDVATLLIDKGADISACNHAEETPLHLAVIHNSSDALKVLRRKSSTNSSLSSIEGFMKLAVTNDSDKVIALLKCEGVYPAISKERKSEFYYRALINDCFKSISVLFPEFNPSDDSDSSYLEMSSCHRLDKKKTRSVFSNYEQFRKAVFSKDIKAVKSYWEIAEKLEEIGCPGTKLSMFLADNFALVESVSQNPCSKVLEYLQEIGRPLLSTVLQGFKILGIEEQEVGKEKSEALLSSSCSSIDTFMFPLDYFTKVEKIRIQLNNDPELLPKQQADSTGFNYKELPFLIYDNLSSDQQKGFSNEAVDLVKIKKYPDACIIFHELFKKRKENSTYEDFNTLLANHNLGMALYAMGEHMKAIGVFKEMLSKLDKNSVPSKIIENNIEVISKELSASIRRQSQGEREQAARSHFSESESSQSFLRSRSVSDELSATGMSSSCPSTSMDNLQTEKHTTSSRRRK